MKYLKWTIYVSYGQSIDTTIYRDMIQSPIIHTTHLHAYMYTMFPPASITSVCYLQYAYIGHIYIHTCICQGRVVSSKHCHFSLLSMVCIHTAHLHVHHDSTRHHHWPRVHLHLYDTLANNAWQSIQYVHINMINSNCHWFTYSLWVWRDLKLSSIFKF